MKHRYLLIAVSLLVLAGAAGLLLFPTGAEAIGTPGCPDCEQEPSQEEPPAPVFQPPLADGTCPDGWSCCDPVHGTSCGLCAPIASACP